MLFIFLSRSRDEEKHLSLSRGMEHQNFGLCAPILYHCAKETCFQVLSRVVRCYHVSSCVILIINVILVTSSLLLISTIIKVNFFFPFTICVFLFNSCSLTSASSTSIFAKTTSVNLAASFC